MADTYAILAFASDLESPVVLGEKNVRKDTKKRTKFKVRPFTKLLHRQYPIGWGTGLNAEEWRDFANKYKPFKHRKSKNV